VYCVVFAVSSDVVWMRCE